MTGGNIPVEDHNVEPTAARSDGDVAAPEATKHKFELGTFAIGVYTLCLMVCLSALLMKHNGLPRNSLDISSAAGAVIALSLLPFGLGWVMYRIVRRSNRTGNCVAIAVMLGMSMSQIGSCRGGELNPATRAEMQRIAGITPSLARAGMSGDSAKVAEFRARFDEGFDELSRTAPSADRGAVRGSRAMLEETIELWLTYARAIQRFVPVADVTVVDASVTMDDRLRLLERAIAAQDELLNHLYRYDAKFAEYLSKERVSAAVIKSAEDERGATGETARMLRFNVREHEALRLVYDRLLILKEQEGHWSVNESGEIVTHDEFPDELLEKFNAASERYVALMQEHETPVSKDEGKLPEGGS